MAGIFLIGVPLFAGAVSSPILFTALYFGGFADSFVIQGGLFTAGLATLVFSARKVLKGGETAEKLMSMAKPLMAGAFLLSLGSGSALIGIGYNSIMLLSKLRHDSVPHL